ncbi:MAG: hypothetical protein ACQGVC_23585 [Myxococcota bacterium]
MKLVYSEAELLRSHDYARPQVEAGHRIHGGFDADGRYLPPRTLVRGPAIQAWTRALRERGGEPLPADSSLLAGIRYPNAAQQKLLLQEGLGQTFWNALTITGEIEARGRLLADMTFPEIQDAVVEDVSAMGVGHLNKGLLVAHGIDEGGEPGKGLGGHDVMWFAARDLAFGPTGFPHPEVPESISRPETSAPRIPRIARPIERTVDFLCNLLLIEFRAERIFDTTETLLRDPELFRDRRAEALRAAELVNRIRTDEEIHVASLRLYLGELRTLTFTCQDGGTLPGAEVVDPLWEGVVQWATVEQPKLQAEQQRKLVGARIAAHPDAARVQREFDALEDRAAQG